MALKSTLTLTLSLRCLSLIQNIKCTNSWLVKLVTSSKCRKFAQPTDRHTPVCKAGSSRLSWVLFLIFHLTDEAAEFLEPPWLRVVRHLDLWTFDLLLKLFMILHLHTDRYHPVNCYTPLHRHTSPVHYHITHIHANNGTHHTELWRDMHFQTEVILYPLRNFHGASPLSAPKISIRTSWFCVGQNSSNVFQCMRTKVHQIRQVCRDVIDRSLQRCFPIDDT